MPQVTQQRARTAPTPQTKGGILSRAVPVGQMERATLKILMYGQNRVGKTTFACQFAKPLLLISFEPAKTGGAESVRLVDGVSILRHGVDFNGVAETVQLARELKQEAKAYKTVVLDSASTMQDMVLCGILNLPAVPDQMSWGMVGSDGYRQRSEKTREVLRPFLDLDVDTIVLAKEKDHNPPKEEKVNERTGKVQPDMRPKFLRGVEQASFIAADLGGATTGWLQDACDCVCRLFVEEEVKELVLNRGKPTESRTFTPTGKFIRYLRTGYHPNYAAGVRSCRPEAVPEVIPNPTAEKLLAVLAGRAIS